MYEFDQFFDDDDNDIFFNEEVLKVADSQLPVEKANLTPAKTRNSPDKWHEKNNLPASALHVSPEIGLSYVFRAQEEDLPALEAPKPNSPNISSDYRNFNEDSGTCQDLHTVSTTHKESLSTTVTRKRKFPGPAGILSDESETFCPKKLSLSEESSASTRAMSKEVSQKAIQVSLLWKEIVAKLSAQHPAFSTYNLGWVREQTQFIFHAPVLVLQLNCINLSGPNAVAHFSDSFGEIRASLQNELTKMYCHLLTPGSILVCKKVNVMGSKLPISHTFHLALTLRSLLSIHYLADGALQSLVHQALDKNEIAQIVETVQMKLSSAPSTDAEEEFPSTSICSGSGQNNVTARPPSLVTDKFPIPARTAHVTSRNFTFKPSATIIPHSSPVTPPPFSVSASSPSLQLTGEHRTQSTSSSVDDRAPTATNGFAETFFDGLDESTFFDEF